MPVKVYSITCTSKKLIARNVYEFTFTKPEDFSFIAGQFVLFDVPLIDDPSDVQTRAFSIASTRAESELLFLVKLKEGGRASRWFEEVVDVDTSTTIKGPFGFFTVKESSDMPLLFIATGSGIAPFRPQILDELEKNANRSIDLVFGVRSEEDLFWEDIFRVMEADHSHFHLHLCMTQPTDVLTHHTGRVQTFIPGHFSDLPDRALYVCGSPVMTKEIKLVAKNEWGILPERIHVEGYI